MVASVLARNSVRSSPSLPVAVSETTETAPPPPRRWVGPPADHRVDAPGTHPRKHGRTPRCSWRGGRGRSGDVAAEELLDHGVELLRDLQLDVVARADRLARAPRRGRFGKGRVRTRREGAATWRTGSR